MRSGLLDRRSRGPRLLRGRPRAKLPAREPRRVTSLDPDAATLPRDHGELPDWSTAELDAPPPFSFKSALKVIGPGAIMAATSIGGGEWLVGPAAAVKYGTQLFLIATVAIVLQVIFNLEAIRYTLYTGEPILAGHHAPQAGPALLGGQLRCPRLPAARLAGARGKRGGDALRRLELPHARSRGSRHAGLDRDRPDPRRGADPLLRRHDRAHARDLRVDHARRRLRVPAGGERRVRPVLPLGGDLPGLLPLHRPAAPDRLGA